MMQLTHFLVAMAFAWLLLWKSPFSRVIKVLLLFGYFFVFEYAVISRNYGISVLLIFAFCIEYQRPDKRWMWLGLLLALLALTNIFGAIISTVLGLYLLLYAIQTRWGITGITRVSFLVGAGIFLSGLLWSLNLMAPPEGMNYYHPGKSVTLAHAKTAFSHIGRSFFPIPKDRVAFWNTQLLDGWDFQWFLSVLVMAGVIYLFAKQPRILLIVLLGYVGMWFFLFYFYGGYMRHHGGVYLLFVAALWLAWKQPKFNPGILGKGFIGLVLLAHVWAGLLATGKEWSYTFSDAKNAAKKIQEFGLDDAFIAAYIDYPGIPVAGYLQRSIFYPERNTESSFIVWGPVEKRWDLETYLREFGDSLRNVKRPTVLISSYPLDEEQLRVELLYETPGKTILQDERQRVYLLLKDIQ